MKQYITNLTKRRILPCKVFNYVAYNRLHRFFVVFTFLYQNMNFLGQGLQKLESITNRQTHRETRPEDLPVIFEGGNNNAVVALEYLCRGEGSIGVSDIDYGGRL